jgi:hypothetical protein
MSEDMQDAGALLIMEHTYSWGLSSLRSRASNRQQGSAWGGMLIELRGLRGFYKQHEQLLQLESRIAGGAVQVACESHGTVEVAGASPVTVVCLTSTGMAAPVASLNTRWPSTVNTLASASFM